MDIYIGNLSFETTGEDLQKLFEGYGTVTSARVITEKQTGRSKGFGFLEMPERDEALKAIESINGTELHGRALRVNESQPKPKSDNYGGGNRRNRW
ncbi:RNA-binding protein [bacterium]|nr:RNA-binding protein [candidate division CSSED10-310 bacterium]